jgi:hypothetical protein
MALVGCSQKSNNISIHPVLRTFEKPEPIKVKIIVDQGVDMHIKTLNIATKQLVKKVKRQKLIIDMYEDQIKQYNLWWKDSK